MAIKTSASKPPEFYLKKCKTLWPDAKVSYDLFLETYEKIKYKHYATLICTADPSHKPFRSRLDSFWDGHVGCPECSRIIGNLNLTTENNKNREIAKAAFIDKAKEVHGDIYDYSKAEYKDSKTKMIIICKEHGEFLQGSNKHLAGNGCQKCFDARRHLCKMYTKEEFIELANKRHNNLYEYSSVNYINSQIKVDIICSKHGVFEQQPSSHLAGSGCPKCRLSKGELIIFDWLKTNKIEVETEKVFGECRDKYPLPFDFWLPENNILIEYDGKQHFEPVPFWGGEAALAERKRRDDIKTNYAKEKGIHLIRIPYTEIENIDTILTEQIIR